MPQEGGFEVIPKVSSCDNPNGRSVFWYVVELESLSGGVSRVDHVYLSGWYA